MKSLRQELEELSIRHRVLRSDPGSDTLVCTECGTVSLHGSRTKENRFNMSVAACPNEQEERREASNRWLAQQSRPPALSLHWSQEMRELYRDSGSQS